MSNFSEKYDRKKFQLFLKEFLPEDLLENTEELQVDEDNEYFKKAILLGSVKSLDRLMVIESPKEISLLSASISKLPSLFEKVSTGKRV